MKFLFGLIVAILISLTGCDLYTNNIAGQAKKALQEILNTDQNYSKYKMEVTEVKLISENLKKYEGVAKVLYEGKSYDVPISVNSDFDNILVQTKPGGFLFLIENEINSAVKELEGKSGKLVNIESMDKTVQGNLSINDNILFLNNKQINPKIEGDFSLSIEKNLPFKNGNAVLIMNNSGGTACPVNFRILLITPDSFKQSSEFGNCSDLFNINIVDEKVVVTLPKFNSAPASTITFDGNLLTKN